MATTTNYGWTTPNDTDLVKDGAAAIRTLGSSIDTTVFNNAAAGIAKTIVDAKGDIIAATAADTVSRLAVGANDTVLIADSSTATGLKWGAPAAGGMTLLSTTTLNSTSNTISITATGYNYLYIEIEDTNNSGDYLRFRFNSDSGNNYSSSNQTYLKNGSATGSTAPDYLWYANQSSYFTSISSDSPNTANLVVTIHNPNSTGDDKIVQYWGGATRGTFADWSFGNGFYEGSGAITSITILANSSNVGTVKIYGVK
jgi:hypothetical protein